MKVCISYQPQEQEAAAALFQAARQILPHARLHRADNKPPFIQLYLTTRSAESQHNIGEID